MKDEQLRSKYERGKIGGLILENKAYREQGLDLKRLVLVIGKKFWLVAAGIVIGGILGGITYKVVTGIINGTPEYRATADYYK